MAATAAHYTPKTKIRLFGFLRKKYFKEQSYLLDRGDTKEAAKAIDVNHPGFARDLVEAESRGLRFAIFKNGKNISEGELEMGGARELWFVPVVAGSKRAGSLQTIVGAVMVVVGAVATAMGGGAFGVPLMKMGAVVGVGGVIQMLSSQAQGLSQSGAAENLPSYAFGSAKNTTASGNPVPICIGERRWGGAIISASIVAEDKA
ncbi:tail assembly protein [Pseudomonas putida]|uniref:tail assembly protein n=1 Tax=Pseudomonas putida TaxID=303 RepID=UPI002363A3C5|nr:tail assembly protein [Pseudomonas putida]MDD1989976.1 tail assembly protein [Pseudomonas putida]HDS1796124.1 tail assembly protein [Pseudomonas putida]